MIKYCFNFLREVGNNSISITGWVCAEEDALFITACDNFTSANFPISLPRPDVYSAINQNASFKFENSYFCGVNGAFNAPRAEKNNLKLNISLTLLSSERMLGVIDINENIDCCLSNI
jgi:hypothetical protein